MSSYPYIAIEGAIGVGKTTLARILGDAMHAEVLLEVFEENPFLGDFYADRARYAFQTQVFFLLSRYRQQHRVIASTIRRGPLVSDYLFAKDWLFAHLNLAGDELTMYERVHSILGEQIPTPSLTIFLKASTETLMERITFRDRAYERQISREYIDALRVAYERFFETYTLAPVLAVDTESMDLVRDSAARSEIVGRVRSALQMSSHQLRFPEIEVATADVIDTAEPGSRLQDLQRFHQAVDRANHSRGDLFIDCLGLTSQIGELAGSLRLVWDREEQFLPQVGNRSEARDRALDAVGAELQGRLADALSSLIRIANHAGVDLESAYLGRIDPGRRGKGNPSR